MPGNGPAPKPDAERRTRAQPAFGWTVLAPRHRHGAPPLPPLRDWSPATGAWWEALWARPQAALWDPSGVTLHVAAVCYEDLVRGERAAAPLAGELRQHYDRHGLNPRAMLQLRWRIGEPAAAEKPTSSTAATSSTSTARRRRLLRSVGGD
jgi:hypothetical protein